MSHKLVVSNSVQLNAAPSKVWQALTKPELVKQYMFNCTVESDFKPWSPILFKDEKGKVMVKGVILELEPQRKLSYSCYGPTSGLPDIPANYTVVTYELKPEGKGTYLSVSQGDFVDVQDGKQRYEECIAGWQHALQGLKNTVEGKAANG